VLVCTAGHHHILIDGRQPRRNLPTGKNEADFVNWKFNRDDGDDKMGLDAMLCTHRDQDRLGSSWDLLNPKQDDLELKDVRVKALYHTGLVWCKEAGGRDMGPGEPRLESNMLTQLVSDRDAVLAAMQPDTDPRLRSEWRNFMERHASCSTQWASHADLAPEQTD
jgi:hypothetical protein